MNNPLVSIIVPTYNRQELITNLVESLLRQDYDNLEIIVVNDGSTDKTQRLLAPFAKYPNFKLISTENGGVCRARNIGIREARGEYLMFCDDDDEIPQDYVSSFICERDADLVIDSYSTKKDDSDPIPVNYPPKEFSDAATACDFLFSNSESTIPYCFFTHGKLFRRDIINKNQISFCEDYKIGEDRIFILDYLQHSKTCRITNKHKYIVCNRGTTTYKLSSGGNNGVSGGGCLAPQISMLVLRKPTATSHPTTI